MLDRPLVLASRSAAGRLPALPPTDRRAALARVRQRERDALHATLTRAQQRCREAEVLLATARARLARAHLLVTAARTHLAHTHAFLASSGARHPARPAGTHLAWLADDATGGATAWTCPILTEAVQDPG